jgi:hypothetical protein
MRKCWWQLLQIVYAEPMPIAKGKIVVDFTMHTEGWGARDALLLNGYNFTRGNESARGKSPVNGIECLGNFAKRCMEKFNELDRLQISLTS